MCHLFIPHNIAMTEVLSVCAYVFVSQLCLTLCNPVDCGLSVSSIHGILQARILEWVPFTFPGDLSNPGIEPGSPALQTDSLLSEPP